ncbi:MAG: VWA domain-containing protein [Planctomycetota bacterium]
MSKVEEAWGAIAQTRIVYQWLRLEELQEWWHWLILVAACTAILGFVLFWYRRDSVEQMKPTGWALTTLRVAALLGVLLYFMQLEKRTEQRVVRSSRVAILVDTSMSMSLGGTPSSVGVSSSISRSDEARQLLEDSSFLKQLAEQHQLSVYGFDDDSNPVSIAALEKEQVEQQAQELSEEPSEVQTLQGDFEQARLLAIVATVLGVLALIGIVIPLGAQVVGIRRWLGGSWVLFFACIGILVSLLCGAFAAVPNTQYSLRSIFGMEAPGTPAEENNGEDEGSNSSLPENWELAIAPSGTESRLGDALKYVLDRESSNPLAGIVVMTDGRSNAGLDVRSVMPLAQIARVPIYTVGIGSAERPKNVDLVEIDAPKRVYPGDRFTLKALFGSNGFDGKNVDIQVLAGAEDADLDGLGSEDEETIEIVENEGALQSVEFQLEPKKIGKWKYAVRALPPSGDAIEEDNVKVMEIEVVERKNRVLIVAGGPMREYQFVRNLLYRDRDVESHVFLQSGSDRTSQESQELLTSFPADLKALTDYDAVIAFDADWSAIPDSSVQALERWVGEQAGGFVMVAGSVEMPKWLSRSATGIRAQFLRSLSPVVLKKSGSALLASGRTSGDEAWPLRLSADGRQSEFLWMTDQAKSSFEQWDRFQGVYSFYSAHELKPGAKALLRFSDPTSAIDGQLPIYMASQFYGAGRTMFIGGGELWRIRAQGDLYFDRLYTKIVRWVSQSRLLLDSDRGVLLVDREQALLGDQIVVRAVLKDERLEPLVQSEVIARLIDPRETNLPLSLRPLPDGSQPGVYTGQFPVLRPGEYTVQLQLGGLSSEEVLSATVKAKVPALEMQRAERNDDLLQQLAVESGGEFWAGVESAANKTEDAEGNEKPSLIESIPPQDQVAYLPGAPDSIFQLRWLGWLMIWIAGCLSLEWLIRRMHRLA